MSEKKTTCPKCRNAHEKTQAEIVKKAEEAYGKVPPEEFIKMRKKSKEYIGLPDSLRQELVSSFNSTTGVLSVDFDCGCDVCGFTFNYKEEVNILK